MPMTDHSPKTIAKPSVKRVSYSFTPDMRVKKRAEFLRIQNGGKKFKTQNFIFICQKGTSPKPRIGITVTTKVHKRAVKRNLLKRKVREVYRKLYSFIVEPNDVVIISYQGAINLTYLEVKKEMNYAFRKLGLLPKKDSRSPS